MKNAVLGFILLTILAITFTSVNTLNSKMTRQGELDTTVSRAMKHSLEASMVDLTMSMTDEELVADVTQGILQGVNSDSKVEFKVYGVDASKGFLDLEVIEHFNQVFGSGKISVRKQIVFDEDTSRDEYGVVFKVEDRVVKEVLNIDSGSMISSSIIPQSVSIDEDENIVGWELETNGVVYDETNIENVRLISDLVFSAVIE